MILHYDISDIIPYINWLYFFHAWSMNGKPEEAKTQLRTDAEAMLKKTHKEVMAIIETFSNEDLFSKGAFDWTGTTTLGSYCVSATSSHYDWAIKDIKKALKKYRTR